MWCVVASAFTFNQRIDWGVATFVLTDKGLSQKLREGDKKVQRAVMARLQYYAPQIEADAKVSAPWTDQTSNARNGLAARAYQDGDETGIILFHQVPYGIYLETRWSGRYAVIMPTIDKWGPIVLNGLNGTMGSI